MKMLKLFQMIKKKILDNVFNQISNKNGQYLKFVLGSKVMNEGISLHNIGEVHILDVHFNLGKVDQVVGRGIRLCKHYDIINEHNMYPHVNVYKYAVSVKEGLSAGENLYRKAELKYVLIKKVERIMKEVALDCPLNVHGNIIPEEIVEFKDCEKDKSCPAICDFTSCTYKCYNNKLNHKYYDPERLIYKNIPNNELDYSTFTHGLARTEINYAKNKIKNMFILEYIYTLEQIVDYIKNSYDSEKQDLFDEFFVFKALDELIPVTENDFNNFNFTLLDKHNRSGYIIYRNKYYIFQPFEENEFVSMYYRTTNTNVINTQLSLYNYLQTNNKYIELIKNNKTTDDTQETAMAYYQFDDEYYNNREEYKYVGYIDKEITKHKNKHYYGKRRKNDERRREPENYDRDAE